MITRIMCEHAGEPDKDGFFKVLATTRVLGPNEVCTDTYIVAGQYEKNYCCPIKLSLAHIRA